MNSNTPACFLPKANFLPIMCFSPNVPLLFYLLWYTVKRLIVESVSLTYKKGDWKTEGHEWHLSCCHKPIFRAAISQYSLAVYHPGKVLLKCANAAFALWHGGIAHKVPQNGKIHTKRGRNFHSCPLLEYY